MIAQFGYPSEFELQLHLEHDSEINLTSLFNWDNNDVFLAPEATIENPAPNMVNVHVVNSAEEGKVVQGTPNYTNMVNDHADSSEEGEVAQETPNDTNMVNDHVVSSDVENRVVVGNHVEGDGEVEDEEEEELENSAQPSVFITTDTKPRLKWTPELHKCFLRAVKKLGGARRATPKTIQYKMNVPGITLYHVKSHLQKYRQGRRNLREWKEILRNFKRLALFQGQEGSSKSLSLSPLQENSSAYTNAKGKAEVDEEGDGSLYRKMESAKIVLRFQAAQRSYLDLALENANRMLSNHYFRGATIGNGSYYGQALPRIGTMAPMPTFYQNQINTYNAYNSKRATGAHTYNQEQHLSSQVLVPCCSEDRFPSIMYPASSHQEDFQAIPGRAYKRPRTLDDDPVAAYLTYDDSIASTGNMNHSSISNSGDAGTSKLHNIID